MSPPDRAGRWLVLSGLRRRPVEARGKPAGSEGDRFLRRIDDGTHSEELVRDSVELLVLDIDARSGQLLGEELAVVAERVDLGVTIVVGGGPVRSACETAKCGSFSSGA